MHVNVRPSELSRVSRSGCLLQEFGKRVDVGSTCIADNEVA